MLLVHPEYEKQGIVCERSRNGANAISTRLDASQYQPNNARNQPNYTRKASSKRHCRLLLTAHELILPWEIIRTHIIYYIFVGAQTFARTELRGSLRRAAH